MKENWVCTQCMSPAEGPECPQCHQAAVRSANISEALPPQTILKGRYLVGGAVGGGGFGITYRALDLMQSDPDRRIIAIKEYFPRNFAERYDEIRVRHKEGKENSFVTWREKFGKEYRMLNQLNGCSAVASVYDVFEENSTVYLVMDFISGETLEARVKRSGPIPPGEVLDIARKLLPSLQKMHSQNVLHRDLNPSNIILASDGMPRLIDFGSARPDPGVIAPSNGLTVLMRMGFAPPEQYKRDGRQGTWTDVYGLCATLYYALTGETPPEARARQHDDSIRAPKDICAVPEDISNAIMHGLELEIADRLLDFREMEDELFFAGPRQHTTGRPDLDTAASHGRPGGGVPSQAFLHRWNAAIQAAGKLQFLNPARYQRIRLELEGLQSKAYNADMWTHMEDIIFEGGTLFALTVALKTRK